MPHKRNGITHSDHSRPQHLGIERQTATEPAADVAEHQGIALQRVWIDGGHRAPAPQRIETHHGLPDPQFGTLPPDLGHPLDPADQDIGPQAANVPPKGGDGTVGCHQ
jgi:hypothetical protein